MKVEAQKAILVTSHSDFFFSPFEKHPFPLSGFFISFFYEINLLIDIEA